MTMKIERGKSYRDKAGYMWSPVETGIWTNGEFVMMSRADRPDEAFRFTVDGKFQPRTRLRDHNETSDIVSAGDDSTDGLVSALEATLAKYVALVESGDAGFWDAESEEHVKASRAALAKAKGSHE